MSFSDGANFSEKTKVQLKMLLCGGHFLLPPAVLVVSLHCRAENDDGAALDQGPYYTT